MFLLWHYYYPIFLLLRNASLAATTTTTTTTPPPLPPETRHDQDDQSGTFEKTTHYVHKTIDGRHADTVFDTSDLPTTVASAFWNSAAVKRIYHQSHVIAELMSDDESDRSGWSRETTDTTDESAFVRDTSTLTATATTTRAFWHSKKQKEARKMRKDIERDFLAQYDLASLQTDLTKLDEAKLKLVCRISSPEETYDTSRGPKFKMKSLRFLTSRKRKMTANLLHCPNMSAYVRESATNPSQCVYIFKRRFFFLPILWLQSQKCVNLKTETTAPPNKTK